MQLYHYFIPIFGYPPSFTSFILPPLLSTLSVRCLCHHYSSSSSLFSFGVVKPPCCICTVCGARLTSDAFFHTMYICTDNIPLFPCIACSQSNSCHPIHASLDLLVRRLTPADPEQYGTTGLDLTLRPFPLTASECLVLAGRLVPVPLSFMLCDRWRCTTMADDRKMTMKNMNRRAAGVAPAPEAHEGFKRMYGIPSPNQPIPPILLHPNQISSLALNLLPRRPFVCNASGVCSWYSILVPRAHGRSGSRVRARVGLKEELHCPFMNYFFFETGL